MMKKLVYISILFLLLLSSCRSKRMITVSLPQPVMQADSTQLGDTIGLPARPVSYTHLTLPTNREV